MDLGGAVVRRRALVLVAWTAAAAVLLPASKRAETTLDVSARIRGSESATVEDALRHRFASPYATVAVLVVTGTPAPDSAAGRAVLARIDTALRKVPGVTRTLSYADQPDTAFLGAGRRGTFIVVGLNPGSHPADALVPPLRAATTALATELRATYPDIALRWTGEVALNYDLRRTSAAEGRAAELRAMPLTIGLLIWAFGALAAALLPGVCGMLAIGLTLGMTVVLSRFMHLSILLQNVVTMLGLGLGIDYALLAVSRFREGIESGMTPAEAAADTARHAGRTIALSGLAVAIGFAVLLGIPLNELRSVAVGGLLVAAVSVAIATTLLPALLSWIGPGIEKGRVFRGAQAVPARMWQAWGARIARHPVRVLLLAGFPVFALAWQARRLSTELPRGNWLPPAMESARGVQDLQHMGRSAVIQAIRIIVELPDGVPPLGEKAWTAVRRLGDSLAAEPGVAAVRSLPSLSGYAWSANAMSLIPAEARRAFISQDGRMTTLGIVPRENVEPWALTRLVQRLRSADAARLTGLPGARLLVGGLPAFNADYEEAVAGRFPGVIVLVVVGTLLALAVGFRSVLIPIKAVALNLLSVAAAFGALVIVFQGGHGARWLGVPGAMHAVFPIVPVLVFCTVFGLSMDYEVFLVARIGEARRRGLSDAEALGEGLARTGGVITSAAAIMIVVFAAFALGDFVLMKMLGFALAVAVFLDATLVRLAIGPALLCLAGKWNWWPGWSPKAARGASGLAVVLLAWLASSCSSTSEPIDRPADWTIVPASLNLAVAGSDTVTMTVLAGPGRLLDPNVGGWEIRISWLDSLKQCTSFSATCPIAVVQLPGANNPRQYRVTALSAASGSLYFAIGYPQGCSDPPDCSGMTWTPQLPPIVVPVTTH